MGLTTPCPDCGTPGPEWHHEPTCPLHLALEKVADGDCEWFEAQPHLTERTRRLDPAELSLLRAMGCTEGSPWVTIRVLAPGVRILSYQGWGSVAV